MTNEQRKAIEICKEKIIEPFYDFPNPTSIELKDTDVRAIETVLNMLKEKDAEIEEKDKQIDLMAKYWNTGLAMCDNCGKIVEKYEKNKCENCIKQYFADLVEKE